MPLLQLLAVLCFTALLQGAPQDIESRVEALLSRMTVEEKLGQLSQSTSMRTPLSADIKTEIRNGRWGSFLNAGSPADRAEAQRIARTESRLHIPLVFGRDVVHGIEQSFRFPWASLPAGIRIWFNRPRTWLPGKPARKGSTGRSRP